MTYEPDTGQLKRAERRHALLAEEIHGANRVELLGIVLQTFAEHRPNPVTYTNPRGCPDHDPIENKDGFRAAEKASRFDRDVFKECSHCVVSKQVGCRSNLCCGNWPCDFVESVCEALGLRPDGSVE